MSRDCSVEITASDNNDAENCAARDIVSRVVKALSVELPDRRLTLSARALYATTFEKNEAVMRQRINKILGDFRVDNLGSCFMVVVALDMVPVVMGVVS